MVATYPAIPNTLFSNFKTRYSSNCPISDNIHTTPNKIGCPAQMAAIVKITSIIPLINLSINITILPYGTFLHNTLTACI